MPREVILLLLFLIIPLQHHVSEGHDRSGAVASKIMVELLCSEPIMEAVDDVIIGDVGDGGAGVEKSFEYDLKVSPRSYLHNWRSCRVAGR